MAGPSRCFAAGRWPASDLATDRLQPLAGAAGCTGLPRHRGTGRPALRRPPPTPTGPCPPAEPGAHEPAGHPADWPSFPGRSSRLRRPPTHPAVTSCRRGAGNVACPGRLPSRRCTVVTSLGIVAAHGVGDCQRSHLLADGLGQTRRGFAGRCAEADAQRRARPPRPAPASKANRRTTVVVLPVPGPPVTILKALRVARAQASFCQSINSSGRAGPNKPVRR